MYLSNASCSSGVAAAASGGEASECGEPSGEESTAPASRAMTTPAATSQAFTSPAQKASKRPSARKQRLRAEDPKRRIAPRRHSDGDEPTRLARLGAGVHRQARRHERFADRLLAAGSNGCFVAKSPCPAAAQYVVLATGSWITPKVGSPCTAAAMETQ